MASTSTKFWDKAFLSFGSNYWKYDVFLSFRGVDTRNGFIDHLYSALHQKVIFTFKDDQELKRGESISPLLLKAIEESRFAVVVFSKNYAFSTWCLEELVKILECQKRRTLTILPVFYKVDPSDLRKQRGSIGEAFTKHELDSNIEEEKQKVQRWRNALIEVANISGWDLETQGREAKLVQDIAIHILNRLGDNGSSILEDIVGLHPRVAEVMSKLEMDLDDPRMVGICGMGGIGKTTIAKAVYHQIHSQFVGSCYLANVRETYEKHGLESLQKSLLVGIRSVSDSDIKIRDIYWLGTISNAVGNNRVLVVLDDVDHSNQLDALVGTLDWFGRGSRIIITTRNSHLLARYGPRSYVYNVSGLNYEEASKLFCCKAFWNNQPMLDFEHLIKYAVDYAKGVPLALKVLGRFLIGRKVNEWQSAIRRLRQEPNPDIQKVLKLSYDGLGREEKKIFLDIACFFKLYSKEYSTVVNMLDTSGFHADIGIRVLEDKALITITDNMIDMHDLIQEMGWHIVNEESPEEPGRRSRLWKYEDIYHTLTKKTGTEAVEAILLDYCKTKEISLSPDTFLKMSNLRLLKLRNVQLLNGLDYLSNDLCLLDWHGYPSKYLPSNFQLDNLVILKMSHSYLKQPWNGKMCLEKLTYVDLSYSTCITKTLDFTQVANLQRLILQGCTTLVEIPSIEAIKRLTILNLRGCKSLKILPTGCWLKSLKELVLSGCSKLKNVSEVVAFTKCLDSLYLGGTCVKELPVEHLNNLQALDLLDCKELTCLPSGICGLKLLDWLRISGCSKLNKLPENLGGLERLQSLHADFTAIKQPPSSIIHLKKLRFLSFSGCKGPVTSTPWNSLFSSFLIWKECQDPMGFELSTLSGLHSLVSLHLCGSNLSEGFLPNDLGSLSSLENLYLSGSNIISFPASIKDLYRLTYLELVNCKKLKTLPYLPINIVRINAGGCTSLETLPNPVILPRKLVQANLTGCHTLAKNRPSLPVELLTNYLKGFDFPKKLFIVVPGKVIPECFKYQNNGRQYVRIQLMPDWYRRLKGSVLCVVFEVKTRLIDTYVGVDCYVMWNDNILCCLESIFYRLEFPSYHLLLDYVALEANVRDHFANTMEKVEFDDLKKTQLIYYFVSHRPEILVPIKCVVHMVYENDEEWPNPHASTQQSDCDEYGSIEGMQDIVLGKRSRHDYDYKVETREGSNPKRLRDGAAQWRDSQSEPSETSIQDMIPSMPNPMDEFEVANIVLQFNSVLDKPSFEVFSLRRKRM